MMNMILAQNKKAYHEYYIEEKLECGISLRGNEVKSAKAGKISIKESWVDIKNGNLVLKNCFITKWETANTYDVEERRDRQLLAHKEEIRKFAKKIAQDGYTLVPISVYIKDGKCKIEIGLSKGKKLYDKRESERLRDINRKLRETYQ